MALGAVRLLRHPGPVEPLRVESIAGLRSEAFRLTLGEGSSLLDGIAQALEAQGVGSAALNIYGGAFSQFAYCLARPLPGRIEVAAYTDPIVLTGRIALVSACGTLGVDEEGAALLHIHGAAVNERGEVIGGHFLPDLTIASANGPIVYARRLSGIEVRRRFDPETKVPVFHPARAEGDRLAV